MQDSKNFKDVNSASETGSTTSLGPISAMKSASVGISRVTSRVLRKRSSTELESPSSSKVFSDSQSNPSAVSPTYSISIATVANGYNSGRRYYIRANSDAERREIVSQLTTKSRIARKSREAKGRLERVRDRVRLLVTSTPFQYLFAILITGVCIRS